MKKINKINLFSLSIFLVIFIMFSILANLNLISAEEGFPEDYDIHFGLDSKIGWQEWAHSILTFGPSEIFFYQEYSADVFLYAASVWRPPLGGQDCTECNNLGYPCGEYQCHSLGASCGIINKGSEYEACIWENENDGLPPEIFPLESVLKNEDYIYVETGASYPEEYGVKIVYQPNQAGCIPPFTEIVLGINTSERAICKIDTLRDPAYGDMAQIMGHDFYTLEHVVTLPASGFPNEEAMQGADFELELNYDYDFFIRCEDSNGNSNLATFDIEFCIQDGPDTEAPVIEETTAPVDGLVGFNTSIYPLEVFTNEPADCRWDFQDLDYERMNYNMTDCSYQVGDYLYPLKYGCRTNLTGVQSGEPNNYFLRCKDKPWWNSTMPGGRFANQDSYPITLIGTYPLQIDLITVNEKESGTTLFDSVDPLKITLKVKTSAGANEGKSKCQYGINGNYIDYFYNGGNFDYLNEHTQDIYLDEGEYNYSIKCNDEANNVVEDEINFTIELDKTAPIVVRVYYEQGKLKLITNEDATCVYNADTCDYAYEDGTSLSTNDGFNHFVDWNTQMDLHIKCKDLFGNLPYEQGACSITARAFQE